jgi:cysteine desulfurase
MRAYFDNASTTRLLPEVIEEMTYVMHNVYGNPSSIHNHGRIARAIIEAARKQVAKVLNTSIGEIFFTSCATEANNMILKMAIGQLNIERILFTSLEHHCVLHTIDYLKNSNNIETTKIPVDRNGTLNYEELISELQKSDKKTLVSVMHGNNEIGVINNLEKIGELCRVYDAYFHSDMVQTIGKYPIDMQKINVHFASASAHKFHGPKGIGFAYIRNDAIIPPLLLGGAQERNMRAGTENLYGIVGLAKAIEIASLRMDEWRKHILHLKNRFISRLRTEIIDITVNGTEEGMYHIASISFPPSPKSELLMFNLDIVGISCSSGSACSSGIESDSHVLQAIGHDSNRKTIRFSFSHFNTIEEVDYAIDQLKRFCVEKEKV